MKYIHLLSFALLGLIWSCSPKAAETVVDNVPESQKPEEVMPDPNTPCTTLKQLKGYIREEVETAFVIYRDQIKINKDYEKAFPLWEKAYYGAPGANGKVKYHFDDGIAIYKHFYENTDDETLRATYVDSVKAIYNKRAECFGGDDYIAGRLAFDYYYTFNNYVSEDETFDLFKQNIDAKGDSADYFVINPFTKMLYDRILNEQISIKEGQKYANQIFKTIEYGQANCKGSLCEAWEIISEYAPVRLEALEGIDGFYDCTYYGDKYYPQFKADSENCETIELVYRRLLRGGCADDDPRLIEVKIAKDTKCYVPPPPPGPLKQAFNAYNEGDFRNAVVKFDDFVQKTDDIEKKAKYLLLIAKIYYRDLKDFPQARKYAMRAAGLKDNWGEPFMLIGKLYASSGPLCGPGRGWDSQIVTWPAIDKWQYAKKIDPSVAEEADDLVRQYWQYMPKKADIFSRLINAGSSFRVQCWIQENTTVRTAD